MVLKELFNKESTCEKCRVSLPKKQLSTYDTTHQGQNKCGSSTKVCNHCLLELLYESLRSFNETAIVISPIQGLNAYVTYNFDNLLSEEKNKKFVSDLTALLPQDNTKCICCGSNATYTWCPSELLHNDPFLWEVNRSSGFEHKYLCKECLVREFEKKIEDEKIKFEFVYPPLQGAGFLCSWEV